MLYKLKISIIFVVLLTSSIDADPPERCISSKPIPVGDCEYIFRGFFYNTEIKNCEEWYARGCTLANKGYFRTLAECNKDCVPYTYCKPPDRCLEPHYVGYGSCRNPLIGYYYNPKTGICDAFTTRGCITLGRNTYVTLSECRRDCITSCIKKE